MRFGERFSVEYDIPADLETLTVLKSTSQLAADMVGRTRLTTEKQSRTTAMGKRTIATILAIVMCALLLTVCTESSAAPGGSNAGASKYSGEKATIRMVRIGNEQDTSKDRLLLTLQEKVNVTLNIISIPFYQGDDKVNIMMSTGDKIDLLNYDPGKTLTDWARNGLVHSYEELIGDSGDYPLIRAIIDWISTAT